MASVFLSYDRDDVSRARQFAHVLEKTGFDVWWDTRVRGGAQFSKVIEEALASADVIVVLWSKESIESPWVRDEAGAGRDTGRLIPVTIDGTIPPIGFRQFQAIDLSRWKGRGNPPQLQMFLADVGATARGEKPAGANSAPRASRPLLVAPSLRLLFATLALFATITTLVAWRTWNRSSSTPTLLLGAARNDAASQGFAADLAAQLSRMKTVQSGSLRLINSSDEKSNNPQLDLEAVALGGAQANGANLVLKNRADGVVVWSQDFEQGSRKISDMKLQMAFMASRVLDCASEALADNGKRLPRNSLTQFLTSCGQTAEGTSDDPQAVAAGLSKVVAQAPRFVPAWRKLLVAEAGIVDEKTLRKHIVAARRLELHMPEATIAEMSIVPASDLVAQKRLIDEAYDVSPENPVVLIRRTNFLLSVGQTSEAAGTAYEAETLDPTSPAALANWVGALLYGGQIDVAEHQLKRAQNLWRGTSTLDDLEERYYLRFGDPKIGLQMATNRTMSPTLLLFLRARANPTKANVDKLFGFYSSALNRDPANFPALSILMQAYGQFHRENELYAIMLHWPNQADFAEIGDIWFRPALHEFRRDPRFMQLAARSPLLRYWRTTGKWPDFCKEPDLPYDCKAVAGKMPASEN